MNISTTTQPSPSLQKSKNMVLMLCGVIIAVLINRSIRITEFLCRIQYLFFDGLMAFFFILSNIIGIIIYGIALNKLLYWYKHGMNTRSILPHLALTNLVSVPLYYFISYLPNLSYHFHNIAVISDMVLNVNLFSLIAILYSAKRGMNSCAKGLWIASIILSLSPATIVTYQIMKQSYDSANVLTPPDTAIKTQSNASPIPKGLSGGRKAFVILSHVLLIIFVWAIPCVAYGRLSWGGLDGSSSTSLGAAIADMASYESTEAALLLAFLIICHVFAVLLLIFTFIGKYKLPITLFSIFTTVSVIMLCVLGLAFETITVKNSSSFWGSSFAAYEFTAECFINIVAGLVVFIITMILLYYRPNSKSFSPPEDTSDNSTVSTTIPPVASAPSSSPEQRLTQLNDLKARGLITEEEYNEKKQSILSEL